jgi:hypothetical protein
MRQPAVVVVALLILAGCSTRADPSAQPAPQPVIGQATCGIGDDPSFPLAVLNQAGGVDTAEDQPAAILHATLRETEGLPEGEGLPAMTVVFAAVRPDDAEGSCIRQVTVETPYLLELSEPLGDRMLLDGAEVPPRDATTCHARVCP